MSDYGPSIPIARLFERVSKKGNHYLTGRLGLAKVVILKSEETTDDGTPIWNVILSPGTQPKAEAEPPPATDDRRQRRPQRRPGADEGDMRDWQRPVT